MAEEIRWLLADLLLAAVPVMAGGLTLLLHRLVKNLKDGFAARQYWFYLDLLEQTVTVVVKSLMPRVNQMKSLNQERRLTPEQITQVQREAREMVMNQLSQAARQALGRLYRDLDSMITARIEAEVFDVKRGGRPANLQESCQLPEK
ncbi:hypothetical protein [Desulforamulus putei]|uniref:Uncharacterized protein n=1 Tax=Desulforamulus putei DSM 12395 TaxID=1121429 RepID=A0A1M4VC43_9FIRM|nr:hypothetical protein [Desulforamulus putei]SHE66507.1 hypothetical protein SAMN02745133_00877 [Desulforamulus putei DSM 12395]